ncbi:MAG: AraC family transcriptional regulator [Lachnospiraceae bacterium]|nr:AraC family transcriptional regulator [Lachnospiraceae bacterium]
MEYKKELIYSEYLQRENDFTRAEYQPEFEFYNAVKRGDVELVKKLCENAFSEKAGFGTLSKNALQSIKYHFAITAAMVARYCIEGGMEHSESYALSDFYIQKADAAVSRGQISDLHHTMCLDYTKRMNNLQKRRITSMPVAKAVDYIYDHLHTRITLPAVAEYVGVNPTYLSRVFKQEMGVTFGRYITLKKLETAKNMLQYSEFSATEIAAILAFANQSYFTRLFHEEYGVTPGEYREQSLFKNELGQEQENN